MKSKLTFLALIIFSLCKAQEKEPIEADRPDQSESPSLTPKGMFQIETGFTYQKNGANSQTATLPTILWKYGVNENFELRLITEIDIDKTSGIETSGLIPVVIGCRIKVSDEKGIVPKTAFLGYLSLPNAASTKYKTDFYAPAFRFAMQNSLTDKLSLSYNLGSELDGFTADPTFIYTLSVGYGYSKHLYCYIEGFGFAPQNDKSQHNIDGGLSYLITNNFVVDLSAGAGITDNAPDYYVSAGFSFRF